MDIGIFEDSQPNKNKVPSLQSKTDAQLQKMIQHFRNGCKKIFHRPGYMNVKGDAPYDFTCQISHRCPKCDDVCKSARYEITKRAEQKIKIQNKKKTEAKKKATQQKYFKGQPGCECKPDNMCKVCFDKLQADVTKYEQGCGAQWQQNFGGMAAGPATVTCRDNYFLCSKCQQQLYFIDKINEQYPHVKLDHMPKIDRDYWAPSSYPYYSGH